MGEAIYIIDDLQTYRNLVVGRPQYITEDRAVVYTDKSNIPEIAIGLFAATTFQADDVITLFQERENSRLKEGSEEWRAMRAQQEEASRDFPTFLVTKKGFVILFETKAKNGIGGASFARDPGPHVSINSSLEQAKHVIDEKTGKLFWPWCLVATKAIDPGEEIFYTYPPSFIELQDKRQEDGFARFPIFPISYCSDSVGDQAAADEESEQDEDEEEEGKKEEERDELEDKGKETKEEKILRLKKLKEEMETRRQEILKLEQKLQPRLQALDLPDTKNTNFKLISDDDLNKHKEAKGDPIWQKNFEQKMTDIDKLIALKNDRILLGEFEQKIRKYIHKLTLLTIKKWNIKFIYIPIQATSHDFTFTITTLADPSRQIPFSQWVKHKAKNEEEETDLRDELTEWENDLQKIRLRFLESLIRAITKQRGTMLGDIAVPEYRHREGEDLKLSWPDFIKSHFIKPDADIIMKLSAPILPSGLTENKSIELAIQQILWKFRRNIDFSDATHATWANFAQSQDEYYSTEILEAVLRKRPDLSAEEMKKFLEEQIFVENIVIEYLNNESNQNRKPVEVMQKWQETVDIREPIVGNLKPNLKVDVDKWVNRYVSENSKETSGDLSKKWPQFVNTLKDKVYVYTLLQKLQPTLTGKQIENIRKLQAIREKQFAPD